MISDEEWRKGPDWSKWTPRTILKKKCDCPDFCERKIVATGYDGSKDYWCRNCGQVYTLKGFRPIRLAPTPAVAQKLRSAEKHQERFTRKIGRTIDELD